MGEKITSCECLRTSVNKFSGHMQSTKLNFLATVLTLGLIAKIFGNLRLLSGSARASRLTSVWAGYNLGHNKVRNKTTPPLESMMNPGKNQYVPFYFQHWNGGRGGLNFSFELSKIVGLDPSLLDLKSNSLTIRPSNYYLSVGVVANG